MFNAKQFDKGFATKLASLQKSEANTRVVLNDVCIMTLEKILAVEDVREVSKILDVLTPRNAEMVLAFFKKFSGFETDEAGAFTSKAKWHAKAAANAKLFLESGTTIWQWYAEANAKTKPEAKPLDLGKVTDAVKGFIKKADKSGISQADLLVAIFAAGFTQADAMAAMQTMVAQAAAAKAVKDAKATDKGREAKAEAVAA